MKGSHKRQAVQGDVIRALAAGASIPEAADAGGVHASTVYRWLERSDFTDALSRARGEGPDERESHGARAHREAKEKAEAVTFAQALNYEETRSWPSWRIRWAFWRREDVPEDYRGDGPDPRAVLTMSPAELARWTERESAWRESRRRWLTEAAA